MRTRFFAVAAVALALALPSLAEDRYLPIAGSVGSFRTDARIVNPTNAEITVNAQLLPICTLAADGSTSCPATPAVVFPVTVPARSQKVLDDVVATTLNSTGLAGIRLTTDDKEFTATARIYAQTQTGTLGQFLTATEPVDGLTRGIVQQLKSNSAFRTNIGLLNPNGTATDVTLFLHGASGVVATRTINLQGLAVIGPTNVTALFSSIPAGTDLSDFWVAFQASQKIVVYGSVVDNATTDPTYVEAVEDSGADSIISGPTTRTFDVLAKRFQYDVTPGGKITAKVGDTVVLRIHASDFSHGFFMPGFVDSFTINNNGTVFERTFTVTQAGNFPYFCTNSACGIGHTEMDGLMEVTE
jgi:hypothetical protein